MKHHFPGYIAGLALIFLLTSMALAQENKKLAQTGLEFLSIENDARVAALAGAVTGIELNSSSLFFNPAGMANMSHFIDVSASMNKWIADINHNAFSLAINPARGLYGVFGVTVQTVDYGEVIGTRVANNDLGYEDTGIINPSAFGIGVGYAKALSDRFSVGGQVKWLKQSLGESLIPETDSTTFATKNEVTPLAFDFGTLFKTGIKSLAFGMSVRNFSQEIRFDEEGFQLPLVFSMGVSANLMDFIDIGGPKQAMILTIDASHPRSHPEQLSIGFDYQLMDLLSLRGGYVTSNDENDFSFGFGISQFGFSLDYAYTPFGVFDQVQRITARFSL